MQYAHKYVIIAMINARHNKTANNTHIIRESFTKEVISIVSNNKLRLKRYEGYNDIPPFALTIHKIPLMNSLLHETFSRYQQ